MWQFLVGFGTFLGLLGYIYRWYRKPYIDKYPNKCVFITGTDSGFGLNLALNLDKCGVKVYAGCFTKDGAENLKKIASDRLKSVAIDVTITETILMAKEAIEKDLDQGQELWGLVNNAGMLPEGYLFPMSTPEDFRIAMEVNFFGTMNVTNVFWPLIKKSAGRIINVISIGGRSSFALEPYTCSKHALEPYTDGLRRWMKYFGAQVSIIEPGVFQCTNLFQKDFTEDDVKRLKKRVPKHVTQECGEEVLDALEQDLSRFISGPPFSGGNNPAMVTNAMKHALFAKHPKDRYVCGYDGKYIYRFLVYLPDWILDLIPHFYLPALSRALKKS